MIKKFGLIVLGALFIAPRLVRTMHNDATKIFFGAVGGIASYIVLQQLYKWLHQKNAHEQPVLIQQTPAFKRTTKKELERNEQLLQEAQDSGNFDKIKSLIASTTLSVHISNARGYTPLHSAASLGNLEMIEYLLNKGAIVDTRDNFGQTPLHYAVGKGQNNMVNYLIDHGAYIDARAYTLVTPLHIATFLNQIDIVKSLVRHGASLDAQDSDNQTPLHKACTKGYRELVEFLLQQGALINIRDNTNTSALHFASAHACPDIIELLLTYGAHIDAQDKFGQTPFHVAVSNDQLESIKLMIGKSFLKSTSEMPTAFPELDKSLQKLCLQALPKDLNGYSKEALTKLVNVLIALDSWDIIAKCIPLAYQKELVNLRQQPHKPECLDQLESLICAHYRNHFSCLKDILEIKDHSGHTAFRLAKLIDKEATAQLLGYVNPIDASKLDKELKTSVMETIKSKLGIQ